MGRFKIGDIVMFLDKHKWAGCLGFIKEIKEIKNDIRYMVGVPVPQEGTAYIYELESENTLWLMGWKYPIKEV